MLTILKKVKNPKYLVITPLKPGDKISKKTLRTVKTNKLPFDWVSYEGDNNIPKNTELALNLYEKHHNSVDYIIKIDNDIVMDKKLLDQMYNFLSKSKLNVGYCYCPFSYILENNQAIRFDQKTFDVNRLLKANYISSNSMIKRSVLEEIGGFVTDDRYVRLLDYAQWLKMLFHGYVGMCCNKGFVTSLNKDNVSARSNRDYNKKMGMIYNDFIIPILLKYSTPEDVIKLDGIF